MTYEQQTAWLAGLLEGEACFHSVPGSNGIRISLYMKDKDVVERAATLMDVVMYPEKRHSGEETQIWRCYVSGDRAVAVANRVLPFMGLRRTAKILALLESAAKRISRHDRARMAGAASAIARRKAGTINMFAKRASLAAHAKRLALKGALA